MTDPGVSELRLLPLRAFWVEPPYRVLKPADFLSHAPVGAPQAILVLDVEDAVRDALLLTGWVPRLRRWLPAHPMALRVRPDSQRGAVEIGRLAATLRVRRNRGRR